MPTPSSLATSTAGTLGSAVVAAQVTVAPIPSPRCSDRVAAASTLTTPLAVWERAVATGSPLWLNYLSGLGPGAEARPAISRVGSGLSGQRSQRHLCLTKPRLHLHEARREEALRSYTKRAPTSRRVVSSAI